MSKKRTILVGIDGAPFTHLKKMSNDGYMSALKNMREEGTFKQMMASIPDNSAVSWSSIMTGKNPGEHGIFGFTDLIPNTYTMRFPNFKNMTAKPFWKQKPDRKTIVINLPFTYPAQEINGYLISGFLSPNIDNSVYPKSFLDYVKSIDYQVDVDTRSIYKSKQLFYNSMLDVHEKRRQLYRKMWQDYDWDTFMIVFTGTDRMGHYMIDSYNDENDEFHDKYLNYYKLIDQDLEWINDKLNPDDTLVMMSDHGMEEIQKEVYINTYLEKNGFLELTEGDKQNYNNITKNTKAFAMEPARIHLNYENRYPNGTVNKENRDKLIRELEDLFYDLKYNGKKVVKEVHKKEDIYSGSQYENAPDLVLVSNKGFSLRGKLGKNKLFGETDTLKGMHRGEDAFFYINTKSNENIPDKVQVEDIQNIINYMEEKR